MSNNESRKDATRIAIEILRLVRVTVGVARGSALLYPAEDEDGMERTTLVVGDRVVLQPKGLSPPDPRASAVARLLKRIEEAHFFESRVIDAHSLDFASVAQPVSIAGVSGSSMHEAVITLGVKLMDCVRTAMLDEIDLDQVESLSLEEMGFPSGKFDWSAVVDNWPCVQRALQQFPDVDWELVAATLKNEYAKTAERGDSGEIEWSKLASYKDLREALQISHNTSAPSRKR